MNRIDKMFAERRAAGKKSFVGFVTAGDPDIETTCALVRELEKAGAALVEPVSYTHLCIPSFLSCPIS